MKPEDGWLVAGRVGPAHGLDGSFRVVDPVVSLLGLGAAVQVRGAAREIDRMAGHDRRLILRLAGCADRAAAEALRGAELLVARAAAPPLGPDEWWAADLVGCEVIDGARAVGVVRELLGLPSCEVLVVDRTEGGELLVPLISDAVGEVDVTARRIEINLAFLGEG